MARLIPIGVDDFRALREQGMEYVDKSDLIREVLDRGAQAILLPRPRRFGKTLNMTMLRCFFEKSGDDLSSLFSDLSIWQAGEAYRAHFQRYPVIFLTFKDVKTSTLDHAWGLIKQQLSRLFAEHRALLDGGVLVEEEMVQYRQVLGGTAEFPVLCGALRALCAYLHRAHGEKVVLLLDEYDAPIHAGHAHGYAPEILDFFRAFLSSGLKGNPHLFKAVITGILRVAKESIFSGLNNLGVFTLLRPDFATSFGFTEPEVAALLDRAGRSSQIEAVRAWYDGHLFGNEVVYNPWSVLSYLDDQRATPRAYWVGTSSNDLVRELLERYALRLDPVFEDLLEGGSVERVLDESVALADLAVDEDALWSLLVFTGYLKPEVAGLDALERDVYRLSIPNREVREVYATTFQRWMKARLVGHGADLARLTRALVGGDAETLEEQLQAFVSNLMSYQDPGTVAPERVYQGFVLGLLAVLEPEYLVRSNRESGAGRPDVTIRPRVAGKPAAVLGLKVARKGRKTPAAALREGMAQIREKGYAAELRAAGASAVHAFAVAFDGKRVWVKGGDAGEKEKKAGRAKRAGARKGKR
jgi:hypothetical protein